MPRPYNALPAGVPPNEPGLRHEGARLAVTGMLDEEVLALAMSSEMTVDEIEVVVMALERALKRRGGRHRTSREGLK